MADAQSEPAYWFFISETDSIVKKKRWDVNEKWIAIYDKRTELYKISIKNVTF